MELIRPPSPLSLFLSIRPSLPLFFSSFSRLHLLPLLLLLLLLLDPLHGRLNRSIQRSVRPMLLIFPSLLRVSSPSLFTPPRVPSSLFTRASHACKSFLFNAQTLPLRPPLSRFFHVYAFFFFPSRFLFSSHSLTHSLSLSYVLQCWQYCEALENRWEKTRTICEGDQYLHVSKFTVVEATVLD